jgi:hypothetical protein
MYWVGHFRASGTSNSRENFMAGLYLGVAVTGAEALVAMALVIAFM